MPMRWDPLVTRALARELSDALKGARVRALLLDPVGRRVVLYGRTHTLLAEMHPQAGWITLHPPVDPPPEARPFPTRIQAIENIPDERILRVELRRIRGAAGALTLVLDFTGNHWNAHVCDGETGRIRHVLVPRPHPTPLEAGAPCPRFPPPRRHGVPGGPRLDPTSFAAAQASGAGEGGARWWRDIGWSSSLNAAALEGPDGWAWWKMATASNRLGGWRIGSPPHAFAYPVPLPGVAGSPETEGAPDAPTLLEVVAALRSEGAAAAGVVADAPGVSPALLAAGAQWIERLTKQHRALTREWEGAPDPAPIRAMGDLLLARFHQVPSGTSHIELEGFDGEPVALELDPALPVHRNADRFYGRAGRIERALDQLPGRIDSTERAIEAARRLVDGVREGTLPSEALERALGFNSGGGAVRGSDPSARPNRSGTPAPLPYRRFRTTGGLEVRVGKGARFNDDLTFRHAAPGDVWLHVREAPGAHVILRWNRDQDPPARDLDEAAALAALYSDARHSGMVPVDWTRRKHVRKPRKAPPGAVIPDRVRTVFATPDPALTERLAWPPGPWPDAAT